MRDIIGFYEGSEKNQEGYKFKDILNFNDSQLEVGHTYIQWLFPLDEPSLAVPGSPILNKYQVEEFRNREDLQKKMVLAIDRMIDFYKFGYNVDKQWLTPRNHNYRRLTRILRSLKLMGLDKQVNRVYGALNHEYEYNKNIIGETTKEFWDKAIQ